jgi:hypothetical protein
VKTKGKEIARMICIKFAVDPLWVLETDFNSAVLTEETAAGN